MNKKIIILVISLIIISALVVSYFVYQDDCIKKEFLTAIDKICSQYELNNVKVINAIPKKYKSMKGYSVIISVSNFDEFYYGKQKEILERLISEKYDWKNIFELIIRTEKNEYKINWNKSDIHRNNEKYTYKDWAKELVNKMDSSNKEYILKIIDETSEYSSFIKNFESYLTSEEVENEIIYQYAIYSFNNNQCEKGINALEKILDYKDSQARIDEMKKSQTFIGTWTANQYVQMIITKEKCYRIRKPGIEVYVDAYDITINEDNIQIYNKMNNKYYEYKLDKDGKLFSNDSDNLVYKKTSQETTVPEEVRKQEPKLGMTKIEAENSTWGKPNKINKTTNAYGVHEQWVYSGYKYLYFDDGILTSIQN